MTAQPPKIDQRTYDDIVRQTAELVSAAEIEINGERKRWLPPNTNSDPGWALIRIFSRMIALVSDRLNQVPEKNFLAFLELLGAQLSPPQPARVPLTFYLAEGSPIDAMVPAHTQVAALPDQENPEEVVFETVQNLVVTPAQLQAAYVRKPDQDKYQNYSDAAFGQQDQAFSAFDADTLIDHHLYISCEEIFSLGDLKNLKLTFTTKNNESAKIYKNNRDIDWFYRGEEAWYRLTPNLNSKGANWTATFTDDFKISPYAINGKEQSWLRVSQSNVLDNSPAVESITGEITVRKESLAPELCLFNLTPVDLSKDVYPFGSEPKLNDAFYILLNENLIKPNVNIKIKFDPNSGQQNTYLGDASETDLNKVEVSWELSNGKKWQEVTTVNSIGLSYNLAFSLSEPFPVPMTINGVTGFWIRARITNGFFGQPPEIRKYAIFNEVAIVQGSSPYQDSDNKEQRNIKLDVTDGATDFFKKGDLIRLAWNVDNTEKIQEHKIKEILEASLILETILKDSNEAQLPPGSATTNPVKILRKSIVTETIAPIYSPPIIKAQSLTLDYVFTLEEKAFYFACNDFTCLQSHTFNTRLKEKAIAGSRLLFLSDTEGLARGDVVEVQSAQNNVSENNRIVAVMTNTQQVTLATPLTQGYAADSAINRVFCPFVPPLDQDPTLYLGLSQSDLLEQQGTPVFNNKPVTLYFDVELPPPGSLPDLVISETQISRPFPDSRTQILVQDATGWQAGDRIQIQSLSTSRQPIDTYFINAIEGNRITLTEARKRDYHETDRVRRPAQIQVVWEYSSPTGWSPLPSVQDETQSFFQRGTVRFIGPADFQKQSHFGQTLYWLRIRWTQGNFRVKPVLQRVLLNTTWAVQAMTLTQEVLGSSNGDRNQIFFTSHRPVLAGQQLEVQEGSLLSPEEQHIIQRHLGQDALTVIRDETGTVEAIWVRWQEVSDFYASQSRDRHYVLDRQTGQIQFGDGQSGMVPPLGTNNIRMAVYGTGGGTRGNKATQTINQLKTTIPYVDRVINLEAAGGGAEREDLEHLKERVPKSLRHRNRAVTEQDFEDLAYAASTEVARVKVITPNETTRDFDPLESANWLNPENLPDNLPDNHKKLSSGQTKIIIVPHSHDPQPTPSLALIKTVETYLRDRCQPDISLIVTGPRWRKVSVTAAISPLFPDQADTVRNAVLQRITTFLHPLSGGQGNGWAFGRYPHQSDLYALIQSVDGVDHVHSLETDPQMDNSGEKQILEADCFIFSGSHTVTVTFHGGRG